FRLIFDRSSSSSVDAQPSLLVRLGLFLCPARAGACPKLLCLFQIVFVQVLESHEHLLDELKRDLTDYLFSKKSLSNISAKRGMKGVALGFGK
ncbi:hypothetical protein BpHYR1_046904, partial [Brachionus plicatilis]